MPDRNALLRSFPAPSQALESFGIKFSGGGAHISRTIMLSELRDVLAAVPVGSGVEDYRAAVLERNVLAKTTDSTRLKTYRHLRELYSLDERVPIFRALRTLERVDSGASLPLVALLTAWARDPLLRSTTGPVLTAVAGADVGVLSLADAIEAKFPNQYSVLSCNRIARNAASSWTQSGHLAGRTNKVRKQVIPKIASVTMALYLGNVSGFHGVSVFENPWCGLLDLGADRARVMALEAHRAGIIKLRAVGEVVEISFPMFSMQEAMSHE